MKKLEQQKLEVDFNLLMREINKGGLDGLVKGRKLSSFPLDLLEELFLVQIQMILNEGDRDPALKMKWIFAVLVVRELQDLRKKK